MGISFDEGAFDSLGHFLGGESPNNRNDIWLWLYLNVMWFARLDPDRCNGSTMRAGLAEYVLSKAAVTKESIRLARDSYLVPDEYLKWITAENRQLQWLSPEIEKLTGAKHKLSKLSRVLNRERLVGMIDIWNTGIERKIEGLERLQASWDRHIKQDHAFEWFEDKKYGQKRCAVAWEWLFTNKPRFTRFSPPIENHNDLLIFFDNKHFGDAEKTLFIAAVKKRWNGEQSREKMKANKKKQCNFVLSEKAIRRLDKLAETHDLTRTQIVEILIQMEADGGSHVTDRLKVLRNL
jgi:hypothetical protein